MKYLFFAKSNATAICFAGLTISLNLTCIAHAETEPVIQIDRLYLEHTNVFSESTLQQIDRGQFPLPDVRRDVLGFSHSRQGAQIALWGHPFEVGLTDLGTFQADNRVVYWLSRKNLPSEQFNERSYPLSGKLRYARYFEVGRPIRFGSVHDFTFTPKWVIVDKYLSISGQGLVNQTEETNALSADIHREQMDPIGYFSKPISNSLGQGIGVDLAYQFKGLWSITVSAKNLYSDVRLNPGFTNQRTYNISTHSGVFEFNPEQPAVVGTYAQGAMKARLPTLLEVKTESPKLGYFKALAGAYGIQGATLPWWGTRLDLASFNLSYQNFSGSAHRLVLSNDPQPGRKFSFSIGIQSSRGTRELTHFAFHVHP